jgi:hypothetical protein
MLIYQDGVKQQSRGFVANQAITPLYVPKLHNMQC